MRVACNADLFCNFLNFFISLIISCVTLSDKASRTLESIQRLKNRLSELIEPDFGLLEQLLSDEVLSHRQYAEILSEKTVYRRNDAVLECLASEEQCGTFVKALDHTGQPHVANYVRQNGG